MIKTCQIRVLLATCIGVVLGNILARHFGVAPVIGLLLFGGGFWILANIANATVFAEKGCEPVGR